MDKFMFPSAPFFLFLTPPLCLSLSLSLYLPNGTILFQKKTYENCWNTHYKAFAFFFPSPFFFFLFQRIAPKKAGMSKASSPPFDIHAVLRVSRGLCSDKFASLWMWRLKKAGAARLNFFFFFRRENEKSLYLSAESSGKIFILILVRIVYHPDRPDSDEIKALLHHGAWQW